MHTTHTYIHRHGAYSALGWFTPAGGTGDFPDVTSLVKLTGRQAGRSPGNPSLIHPSGSQRPGSGGGNRSAAVAGEMPPEELWECYEGG